MKIFFSVGMTKTFQHLKQFQATPIVSALSLESVSHYKAHKWPKMAATFETLFCSQSLMDTPLFTGDIFQWVHFCNEKYVFCK